MLSEGETKFWEGFGECFRGFKRVSGSQKFQKLAGEHKGFQAGFGVFQRVSGGFRFSDRFPRVSEGF